MNWNRITHPRLLEEVQGEGTEGSGQQSSAPANESMAVFGQPANGEQQQQPGGEQSASGESGQGQQVSQTNGQSAPAPVQLTPDQLSQIIRESYQAAQPAIQQQGTGQSQQVSEADFKKYFKIPEVDENMFVSMFGLKPENPQQLASFNQFAQNLMYAAARMAVYQNQATIEQVQQQYRPLAMTVRQQQAEREEKTFFGSYKHLEPHKDAVLLVRKSMLADGVKFDTPEAAMKGLAEATDKFLQKVGVRVGANGGQGSQARPNGQTRMPTTNIGGQVSHTRQIAPGEKSARDASIDIFRVPRR